MRVLTYIIPQDWDGKPLRSVLRGELKLSYGLLKSLKWRENAILLNDAPAHVNAIVRCGDTLRLSLGERGAPPPFVVPCAMPLDVVYEDEDLLVINKPAGVAMHPKSAEPAAPSMAGALLAYLGGDTVAHFVSRLDKGTGGLFLAAKSGYVHDRMRAVLHSEDFRREYRAIAVGAVSPPRGEINLPIARAEDSIVKRCVAPDGLPSRTSYEVLSQSGRFSLLRLVPHTGRTHQLRVHMSAIGYPLAGDWLYGTEDPALIARPALHSYLLRFTHPISGKEFCFTAEMPEDMQRLMN